MSIETGRFIETFSIGRGVMNETKDRRLRFVKDLKRVGMEHGAKIHGSLGLASIDLVTKAEAIEMSEDFPPPKTNELSALVDLARDIRHRSFRDYLRYLPIEEVCLVEEVGCRMIGAVVIDEGGVLGLERQEIAKAMSLIIGKDVSLPEREFYVNLAQVDQTGMQGLSDVMRYAQTHVPDTVDVYDVYVRAHAVYPEDMGITSF